MKIDGPLKISLSEQSDGSSRKLELAFTGAFRRLDLPAQGAAFREYVESLRTASAHIEDDERTREGVYTILQIAEQLLPHVEAGEMTLEEPIEVEVRPDFALNMAAYGDDMVSRLQ